MRLNCSGLVGVTPVDRVRLGIDAPFSQNENDPPEGPLTDSSRSTRYAPSDATSGASDDGASDVIVGPLVTKFPEVTPVVECCMFPMKPALFAASHEKSPPLTKNN